MIHRTVQLTYLCFVCYIRDKMNPKEKADLTTGVKVFAHTYLYSPLLPSPQCGHPVLAAEHGGCPAGGQKTAAGCPPEGQRNTGEHCLQFGKEITILYLTSCVKTTVYQPSRNYEMLDNILTLSTLTRMSQKAVEAALHHMFRKMNFIYY